jgi:hypothetical protein
MKRWSPTEPAKALIDLFERVQMMAAEFHFEHRSSVTVVPPLHPTYGAPELSR